MQRQPDGRSTDFFATNASFLLAGAIMIAVGGALAAFFADALKALFPDDANRIGVRFLYLLAVAGVSIGAVWALTRYAHLRVPRGTVQDAEL